MIIDALRAEPYWLVAFLVAWLAYLVAVYALSSRRKIDFGMTTVSHIAPSLSAITILWVFFANGSIQLWTEIWPNLLLATAISALVHLVVLAWSAFRHDRHGKQILLSILHLTMSSAAFVVVFSLYPTA